MMQPTPSTEKELDTRFLHNFSLLRALGGDDMTKAHGARMVGSQRVYISFIKIQEKIRAEKVQGMEKPLAELESK